MTFRAETDLFSGSAHNTLYNGFKLRNVKTIDIKVWGIRNIDVKWQIYPGLNPIENQ